MSFQSLDATTWRIIEDLEGVYDDSRIGYDVVRDKVLVARASVLMKNFARYPGNLPPQLYNVCCFEVACEPVCPGAPIEVVRGHLPSAPLATLGKRAISYLGSADYAHAFEWRDEPITIKRSYVMFGSERKESPYYVMTGDSVEVYNRPTENMTNFIIRAIFADPHACECPDDKIFVPQDLIDQIEQQVKYDIASIKLQRKMDKMNNTNADN